MSIEGDQEPIRISKDDLVIRKEDLIAPQRTAPVSPQGGFTFCSSCGTQVPSNSRFCNGCGNELRGQLLTQTPVVSSPLRDRTNEMYVPNAIIDGLPSAVRSQLSTLSANEQSQYLEEFNRKRKKLGMAYVLWFLSLFTLFLGFIGWHYVYVKRTGWLIVFWVTFGGLFIWWIIDIFRMPSIVRGYNKDVAISVMRNLRAMGI